MSNKQTRSEHPRFHKISTSIPHFLQWNFPPSWTQLPVLCNNQTSSLSPSSDSTLHLLPNSDLYQIFGPSYFSERVLDSLPLMYYEPLTHMAPLSPPLTSPTFTSSLPKLDNSPPLSPLVGVRTLSMSDTDSDSGSPLLTPSSQSTCSSLSSPVSPTSPDSLSEWRQHSYSLPDSPESPHTSSSRCFLLRGSSIETSPSSLGCVRHDDKLEALTLKQPPLSPLGISDSHSSTPFSFSWYSSPPEINPPLVLDDLDFQDHLSSAFSPETQYTPLQEHVVDPIYDTQTSNSSWTMEHVDPSSPRLQMVLLPSLDCEKEIIDNELSSPISPPDSPAKRSFTALPDDRTSSSSPRTNLDDCHISEADDTISWYSPSITTLLSLPGAEADEDLIPPEVGLVKIMPSERLLSIMDGGEFLGTRWNQHSPGPEPCTMLDADIVMSEFPEDDELKRVCALLKKARDAERAAKQLEVMVEEEERVKSSMLKSAGTLAGNGNGKISCNSTRLSDARKTTKRRKERVREVATLMRLKLAQRGWKVCKTEAGTGLIPVNMDDHLSTEGPVREQQLGLSGKNGTKCMIASPHQLLAKMVMDRHEPKSIPPSKRIIISGKSAQHKIPTSPLAKWSTSADVIGDDEDDALPRDHGLALNGTREAPVELDDLDLGFSSDGC